MTSNQIKFGEYVETVRHNKATETETQRANLAKETETARSDLAKEAENKRANMAKEAEDKRYHDMINEYNFSYLSETGRHNKAVEELNQYQIESVERNVAAQTAASMYVADKQSQATMYSADRNLAAAQTSANAARYAADKHAEATQYQATLSHQTSVYATDVNAMQQESNRRQQQAQFEKELEYKYADTIIDDSTRIITKLIP